MKTFFYALALTLILAGCGQAEEAGQASSNTDASEQQAGADSTGVNADKDGGQSELSLEAEADKRSYALGMDIGRSLGDIPMDISIEHLKKGLTDMLAEREPQLSEEELSATMQAMMSDLESAQQQDAGAKAEENAKQGQAFLEKNKSKEGVEVTDSGLQYKVVKPGEGASPGTDDRVQVHYVGRLTDGTVFDSSRERGEPVTFPVGAVIPGWTEALQLMKPGARYKLFIPPDLAYGERGAGANIGPNETLVFEVELLEVQEGEQAAAESGSGAGSNGNAGAGNGGDSGASDSGDSETDSGSDAESGNSAGGSGNSQ